MKNIKLVIISIIILFGVVWGIIFTILGTRDLFDVSLKTYEQKKEEGLFRDCKYKTGTRKDKHYGYGDCILKVKEYLK